MRAGKGAFGGIAFVLVFALVVRYEGALPAWAAPTWARVQSVTDGDTIVLEGGRRVRYLGIDAPEVAHEGTAGDPLGDEAARYNRKLVSGGWARLEFEREREDDYGRLLAYVFLEDGTLVNRELVRQGLAYLYAKQRPLRYWDRLLDAQRQAMKEQRGLWSLPPPRPEAVYVANKRSGIFHRPSCPLGRRTKPTNRVQFKERNRAFSEGFCPCRQCRP
ncbi:MAG TPA: thermonuclease family protein [Syntrophobacteria bacterium]|nr:thermonuclease family protein [Syntrophobacteria bacterium]